MAADDETGPPTRPFGFLSLFGLPFAGIGAFTGYVLLRDLVQGNTGDTERLMLLAIFPLVFGGVGIAAIWADRWTRRRSTREHALRQLHPEEPWRWNPDWVDGRIRSTGRSLMIFVWGFALLWNLISAPLLIQLPAEIDKGNWAILVGLLFPAVGLGLMYWAVKSTLRHRRFGVSEFRMAALPGKIGGRLEGRVETGMRLRPTAGVVLKLTSVYRRRSSGKNKSTHERILWQDEYRLTAADLQEGPRGLTLPVAFEIPGDCSPTEELDPGKRHLWRLEAAAELDGVDFHAQFEVPVFVTDGDPAAEGWPAESPFVRRERELFDPASSPVLITPTPSGGTEFVFPAGRNRGAALALTVFALIFGGATAGLVWMVVAGEMPLLFRGFIAMFPIVFGLVTVLLLYLTLDAWFATSRVRIADGKLRARRSIFGSGQLREIALPDIADIKLGIGMSQSQTATQSGKAYYDIEIHPRHGKRFKAAHSIPNKREAEWLAAEMERLIDAA